MSASPIMLRELEPTVARLEPGEVEFLARRHHRHLTVRPLGGEGGACAVTPGAVCGIIPLPSGRAVHIEPKARIAGVWRMLAEVWGPVEIDDAPAGGAAIAELFDGAVTLYVRALARLIGHGLARGYVRRRSSLPMVRGRLEVCAQMRLGPRARHRFACVYDEPGVDTHENRVLLAALGVARARSGSGSRLGPLIRQCMAALSEVRAVPMDGAEAARAQVPPGAEHYRTALSLARLLLAGCGGGHRPGAVAAPALVVEMPALFERFVCAVLERGLPRRVREAEGVRVRRSGHAIALDEDGRALLIPDAVIECRGAPVCVVDAKYKVGGGAQVGRGAGWPGRDDLYQMLAYCVGYRVPHAAVVYPEPCARGPVRIERGSVRARVHALGLDLSGDRAAVDAQCAWLCAQVAALAGGAAAGIEASAPV